ncbi:MAG: AbrB/MazE/SpoVT family DNA-binding domain-containing protein [Armatimonadota bacterium]|nr:AbrB/MazE/SpoVT family DNA-binding domain-containing protein [Armatimonadota bacterium]
MPSVTVSSKYQVVIPKDVRERLGIQPGQELQLIVKHGAIHLVPVPALQDLRGFVKGIDTSDIREKEDRY